jgi:hypothetical protein
VTATATTPWEVCAFAMKDMVPLDRGSLGEVGRVCIVQVEQLSGTLKVFITRLEIANGRIKIGSPHVAWPCRKLVASPLL